MSDRDPVPARRRRLRSRPPSPGPGAPAREESVEAWARTAHFTQPVSLGEVEAGILSRPPVRDDLPWWVPVVGYVGWAFAGLFYLFGFGITLVGIFLVWMGTRPDAGDGWFAFATMVFVVSALTQVSALFEQRKERGLRDASFALMQVPTVLGCVGAYVLMRSVDDRDVLPDALVLGVLVAGLLSTLVLAVAVAGTVWSAFHPRPHAHRKPVRRGPRRFNDHQDYVTTRERVLDILTERRLVRFDETDRIRLRGMPLGYWEELDGVDEREWRRILEHRHAGWREFTEADRRPWPPG